MTLYSYVEQVMTMCHIYERQLLLAYFLSYFPLIVYAAMLSILNTVSIIIKKLYDFVEKGLDKVLCITNMAALVLIPPVPPDSL